MSYSIPTYAIKLRIFFNKIIKLIIQVYSLNGISHEAELDGQFAKYGEIRIEPRFNERSQGNNFIHFFHPLFLFILIKNAKIFIYGKMKKLVDNIIFKVAQKSLDPSVSSSKTKLVWPESHGALLRLIHMKCKSWDRNTIRNHVTL